MGKRTDQINVKVDPSVKAELAEAAAEQHRPLANLVLAIVLEWLQARRAAKPTEKQTTKRPKK